MFSHVYCLSFQKVLERASWLLSTISHSIWQLIAQVYGLVCKVATWSSINTFTGFYKVDVTAEDNAVFGL